MKTVELICKTCGKSFTRLAKIYNANLKRGQRDFYCSLKCRWPDSDKLTQCGNCGKEFHSSPVHAKRSKSGNIFCSRSCSAASNNHFRKGENHPGWKGGIGTYRSRKDITECESCGEHRYWLLIVHHKDSDRSNNVDENLIVLCYNCHAEQHLVITDGLLCVNWKSRTSDEIRERILVERRV